MADNIEWGRFSGEFKTAPKGSSKAQNAPQNAPLRFQEDDDLLNLPNPIERFWIPIAVAIVAGWGALGFFLVNTFGWAILAGVAGIVAVGAASAVAVVKTGHRDEVEIVPLQTQESEDIEFSKAA